MPCTGSWGHEGVPLKCCAPGHLPGLALALPGSSVLWKGTLSQVSTRCKCLARQGPREGRRDGMGLREAEN